MPRQRAVDLIVGQVGNGCHPRSAPAGCIETANESWRYLTQIATAERDPSRPSDRLPNPAGLVEAATRRPPPQELIPPAKSAHLGLVHTRTVGPSMARPMAESIRPFSRMGNLLPTFVGSFGNGPTDRSGTCIFRVLRPARVTCHRPPQAVTSVPRIDSRANQCCRVLKVWGVGKFWCSLIGIVARGVNTATRAVGLRFPERLQPRES